MPNKKENQPGTISMLILKLRSIFGLNIGTIIFGVLLLYMFFSMILYLTSDEVEMYQVIAGPLSRNETYTGLAIREEITYKAESGGYVNYYAREGNKINANGAVYGISSTKSPKAETVLNQDDLKKIRNEMLSFSKGFDSSNFNSTYSFKYELEGDILQYSGVTENTSSIKMDENGNIQTGNSDVAAFTASTLGNQTIVKAAKDGIILYSTDDFVGKKIQDLTAEDFNQNSYKETDLKTDSAVKVGEDIYTIVTDERWSLVIPLSEKQAVSLVDKTVIRVKFLKDDMTQSGDFSIIEIDGEKYGKIDFNKGLIRYASERFLDIELVTNTASGLKIPLTSIVTKNFYTIPSEYAYYDENSGTTGFWLSKKDDNGETIKVFVNPTIYASIKIDSTNINDSEDAEEKYIYYVDMSSFKQGDIILHPENNSKYTIDSIGVLEGVYCINTGYTVFRRIIVINQNEEYAIVEKGTKYGLVKYDHIVKNAKKMKESDILY